LQNTFEHCSFAKKEGWKWERRGGDLVFGLLDDIDNTNYARGNTLNKKIFSINMWNQIKESLLREKIRIYSENQ